MMKLLKSATIAVALLWGGTVQAAATFVLKPGETINLVAGPGTGPWISWFASGYGDYEVSAYYQAETYYYCPPYQIDPDCQPLIYDVPGSSTYTANPTPALQELGLGTYDYSIGNAQLTFFSMSNSNISIAIDDPWNRVPEPSTWAMMIAGFGMIGGALRRAPRHVAV